MSQEPPSGRKRLTKGFDRKLGGVAGGFAEYFELDPTLVRVLWVVALFIPAIGFGAVVAYVIMWFVMPEPEGEPPPPSEGGAAGGGMDSSMLLGILILAVGLMLLLRQGWVWMPFFAWGGFALFWPTILILVGVFIVYSARRRG